MKDELTLRRLKLICLVCDCKKIATRKKDNMRRCERCGEEWPKPEKSEEYTQ